MSGGCLTSTLGNGSSVDNSVVNLFERIAGSRVVVGAYTNSRRELDIPNRLVIREGK